MRLLILLAATLPALAQPTVSSIRLDYVPAPNGSAPHSYIRFRWNVSSQACNHRVNYGQTISYGYTNSASQCQTNDLGFDLTGLKPNTPYFYQVQSSFDGATWSTGGTGSFTTAVLPAVHPAPPQIAPGDLWNPIFPNTAGYNTITIDATCTETSPTPGQTLNQAISDAVTAQPTNGTKINIDPAAVCTMPTFADDKQILTFPTDASHVNTTTGVFSAVTIPAGWTLANGQAVILSAASCLPDSATHGNGDNAYNPNTGCVMNGQLISGVVYYLGGVSGSTFKLAKTPGGSPIIPGDTGAAGGTFRMEQWPLMNSNWIILQASAPDSAFCPQGVRCMGSIWSSKMPIFRTTGGCFNCNGGNTGQFTHNIWFRGIQITSTDVASLANTTVDPQASNSIFSAPDTWMASYLVFDRCYFHGQDFPNRYNNFIAQMGGRFIAVINSDWEGMDYWSPSVTPTILNGGGARGLNGSISSQVLTIVPGTAYLGPINTCTVASNIIFTITGGISTGTAFAYLSSTCVPTLVMPAGMTGTASGSATDSGSVVRNAIVITSGSPAYPRDASGGINCFTMGQFNLTSGTASGYSSVANVPESNWTCGGTGTCAYGPGVGPGPFSFLNNYFEGTGLTGLFATDGAIVDPVGIWFRQNSFVWLQKYRTGSTNSNNLQYRNRNGPEAKHGREIKFDGNVVSQNWAGISAGGPAILFHSGANNGTTGTVGGTGYPGYTVQDVDITNNTCLSSATCFEIGNNSANNLTPIPAAARLRVQNNLMANINGFIQNDGNSGNSGNGGASGYAMQFDGPIEDLIVDHNTIYDNRGIGSYFFHVVGTSFVEGCQFTNNFIWANGNQFMFTSEAGAVGPIVPSIGGTGISFLNSWCTSDPGTPGAIVKNNVAVPYYTNFTNLLAPTGFVDPQSVCSSVGGGTISGDNCPGGLFTTVLNHGSAPGNLAQIRFTSPTLSNWKLLYNSPFISGQHQTTDGTDVGVDMNALLTAQGAVGIPTVTGIGPTGATIRWWAYDGTIACAVDYAATPNDPSTQTGGGRLTASIGNSQSVTLSGLTATTQYNYRVLCPVNQPTGSFISQ
jgi:hypothetical protein